MTDYSDETLIDLFGKGLHQFGLRVHRIQPQQWALSTPCIDWTVRELVTHLVDEQRWVPPLLRGESLEQATSEVEGAGDLLAGGMHLDGGTTAWDESAGTARMSFASLESLDQQVHLSRGSTPARAYLSEMICDLAVHSWDLGKAISHEDPMPDDLVTFALEQFETVGDLSGSGFFGPPVDVPSDAPPLDRLVALTGRTP